MNNGGDMKAYSRHWDTENGTCAKHDASQLPCPACMANGGDAELVFMISIKEVNDALAFGRDLRDLTPTIKNPQFQIE